MDDVRDPVCARARAVHPVCPGARSRYGRSGRAGPSGHGGGCAVATDASAASPAPRARRVPLWIAATVAVAVVLVLFVVGVPRGATPSSSREPACSGLVVTAAPRAPRPMRERSSPPRPTRTGARLARRSSDTAAASTASTPRSSRLRRQRCFTFARAERPPPGSLRNPIRPLEDQHAGRRRPRTRFHPQDQHGNEVALAALKGEPVVIVFYPFTFTGVCEGELCQIRDDPSASSAPVRRSRDLLRHPPRPEDVG